MGGLSIFLGTIVTLLMSFSLQDWITLKYFFVSLSLMFIIGLRDDILALSPKQKLASQFLPVLVLVLLGKTLLQSTYGLGGQLVFSELVSMGLTIFVLIILTNAYNLIDGLDGLAGTIGFVCLVFFGFWFYQIGDISLSIISFLFSGSVLAFLFFNWQPSRIFMGDTGALMIGFLLSYLTIHFIDQNASLAIDNPARFESSVSTAICVMIIPIFDTLRVIILRLRKGQSPFRADRNHIHHQFLNLGYSHAKAVLVIGTINIFFILLAWLLKTQGDWLILSLVMGICLLINYILRRAQKPAQ
jgi:UDP-GlcNAc:undecaprenyl-phosphate/decaprenyl-phosphate GlcNAc-1-phosphate transferase